MISPEVWVPCRVKPGPFSDEWVATLLGNDCLAVTFVHPNCLEGKNVVEGYTFIKTEVEEEREEDLTVRVPGHPLSVRYLTLNKKHVKTLT